MKRMIAKVNKMNKRTRKKRTRSVIFRIEEERKRKRNGGKKEKV